MDKSDSIKELAAALAKAQTKMGGARKDKNNPAFKSKYADLSSVTEAIDSAIPEFGLAYVQVSHDRPEAAAIETIILHASGEWLSCGIVSVPVTKHDAHGFGSALTYARRYSLSAGFGVVPEDDDGNAAAQSAPARAAPRPAPKPDTKPSAEQETRTMDWVAALDECDTLDALKAKFETAYTEIHAFGFPMLANLLIAAKDRRKNALAEKAPVTERKAA